MGPKAAGRARAASKVAPHETSGESGAPPRHGGDAAPGTNGVVSKNGRSEMEAYFDKLRLLDKVDNDNLGAKGILQLMADINVSPNTLESFVLLWRLGATRNSRLSRSEWITTTYTYGIDTPAQLKLNINEWVGKVRQGASLFFDMYSFLYDYIRGELSRLMTVESAIAAWQIFFATNKTVAQLIVWVKNNYSGTVSRDLWRQVYFFVQAQEKTDEEAADTTRWPTVLGDFWAYQKTLQKS